jgi:hypothetical protein
VIRAGGIDEKIQKGIFSAFSIERSSMTDAFCSGKKHMEYGNSNTKTNFGGGVAKKKKVVGGELWRHPRVPKISLILLLFGRLALIASVNQTYVPTLLEWSFAQHRAKLDV